LTVANIALFHLVFFPLLLFVNNCFEKEDNAEKNEA